MADKKESPEAAARREQETEQKINSAIDDAETLGGFDFSPEEREHLKESLREFRQTTQYKQLQQLYESFLEDIQFLDGPSHALATWLKSSLEYSKYMEAALEDLKDTCPNIGEYSLEDLFNEDFEDNGVPIGKLYKEAEERARQRFAQAKTGQDQEDKTNLPQITAKLTEILNYPLDKPNNNIWRILAQADTNGQFALEIDTASTKNRRKGKEALVYYSYSLDLDKLDGVQINKNLTQFDKRVCIAAAALYNAGNDIVTASQIHYMMGNDESPASNQIEKINASLDKMRAATIHIDNRNEIKINKGYPKFLYDGAVVPFERVRAYINNTLTDAAIHLFREPPMISFARGREQITTVPRILLQSPISKTDENLAIDDYLIEQISHMKNKTNYSRKMLYATICEHCQITGKQRQRAPGKIKKYLDYYTKCDFIKGFDLLDDGVKIRL